MSAPAPLLDATWNPRPFADHPATALEVGAPLPALTRTWTVFLLPHSHTDIGFTDTQPACLERHSANLDTALLLVEQTRDYPAGAQLKWNVEASLQLEHFTATRPRRQVERAVEACRRGEVGIEALWGNLLTGLCATEELCRLTQTAAAWRNRYGLAVDTAMLSDVCGYTWNVPQILARSGVRFLSCAMNNHRAPFHTFTTLPPLFYWQGPDGSRVLTWLTDTYGYARFYRLFLRDPLARPGTAAPAGTPGEEDLGVPAMARRLFPLLAHLEATDYPYDAILLRASLGDNRPIDLGLADAVRAFNETFAGRPRLRIALSREFADYAEAAVDSGRWPRPPTFAGDMTGYWEDGAGSSALETAITRQSQRRLFTAEARHALAAMRQPDYPYPAQAISDALHHLWLYDEHTWGASASVREPQGLATRLQWQYKSDYALEGAALLDQVEATLSDPGLPRLESTNDPSPSSAGRATWDGKTLQNEHYRLDFDPVTGTVLGLLEKASGHQLADTSSPFRLNQYWYERYAPENVLGRLQSLGRSAAWLGWLAGNLFYQELPEKQAEASTAAPAPPQLTANGPTYAEVTVDTTAPGCRRLVQRCRLYADGRGVEFVNELDKELTYEKESGYFTFPCATPTGAADVRLELGGVALRPEKEQLPGGCRDWYAVQRFAAVGDAAGTVLLNPVDAPLVCVGGLTPELWRDRLPTPLPNGTLASWVFNNHWEVNYRAGQGGLLCFRYRLGAHAGEFDAERALAWLGRWPAPDAPDAEPPRAGGTSEHGTPQTLLAALGGAVGVQGSADLIALKRAEDGARFVARLVEMSGRPADVWLHLPVAVARAWRAALTEEYGEPLDVRGTSVRLRLRPREIATVVLEVRP